jgi:sulfur relay protein TusB/DsrH
MLVLIKSAPDTPEARGAVRLAMDSSADVVLLQNGVYHCDGKCLWDFAGSIYALKADQDMRGLKDPGGKVESIGYEELVDLIAESENVAGLF